MRKVAYPILRLARKLGFLFFRLSSGGYSNSQLAAKYVEAELLHLRNPQLDDGDRCAGKGRFSASHVIDFGGGGGRHLKSFSGSHGPEQWAVVETTAFCQEARDKLSWGKLSFFDSIEDASKSLPRVDLVHASSSIQYTDSPLKIFESLLATNSDNVVIEKLVVTTCKTTQIFWQYSSLRANIPYHPDRKLGFEGFRYLRYKLTAETEANYFLIASLNGYLITESWSDPMQSHLPLRRGLRQIGMVLSRSPEALNGELK